MNTKRYNIIIVLAGLLYIFSVPAMAKVARGITEPSIDATLSSTVPGRISTINFSDGTYVTQGAVILTLESTQEALEVNRRKLIAENNAELNAALTRMQTLKAEMDSSQELYTKTHSVSKEELQKKVLEYTTAREELESIKVNKAKEAHSNADLSIFTNYAS